jgi:imidazole glycerol-phosphate synthase subunit HisH
MITIVDYGVGNLGSVYNMLRKVGLESEVTGDVTSLEKARRLILPGVGAFRPAMEKLKERGLIQVLTYKAMEEKIPVLGICLGMQLMTESSEEGGINKGLSWINGRTVRFSLEDSGLKVPHKGWNYVKARNSTALFPDANEDNKFYFDHSYYVHLNNPEDELVSTSYGVNFTSGFQKENLFGVQFHPEKSHKYGMNLLQRFSEV